MPLYGYRCTSCSYHFDKIQKYSDAEETVCPRCGGELERPLTAPALQFKGAGWYVNDYAAKPAAGGKADKISAEAAPAGDAKPAESKPTDSKPATTETKSASTSDSTSKPSSGSSSS